MASTVDFDVNDIVSPIPGERPSGVDLRIDPERNAQFRSLRELREEARRAERKADIADPDSQGDSSTQSLPLWRKVRDAAHKLLCEDSKDLDVVSYFIEALVRTDGFAGLKLGFRAARELVENFWDGLYPEPDEDGIETRVLPLARLNGVEGEGLLPAPIQRIAMTEERSLGPFACWHYLQATKLPGFSDREREERIARGAVTMEMFSRAVAESETQFLRDLVDDILQCQQEFEGLCTILDEKCGLDSPPSSSIREALETCLTTIRSVARDRLGVPTVPGAVPSDTSQAAATVGGSFTGGVAENREQAFQTLLTVADFFDHTEPLSLLGTQIRKIVRLGRMSPAEYYSELIEDPTVRDNLFKMVGIKSPSEGESY